ncbi:MAG: hypothetical protein GY909_04995 [Oligoflexia bacterium]|nr:hypothetical protein [Oligoflexia bacterium]
MKNYINLNNRENIVGLIADLISSKEQISFWQKSKKPRKVFSALPMLVDNDTKLLFPITDDIKKHLCPKSPLYIYTAEYRMVLKTEKIKIADDFLISVLPEEINLLNLRESSRFVLHEDDDSNARIKLSMDRKIKGDELTLETRDISTTGACFLVNTKYSSKLIEDSFILIKNICGVDLGFIKAKIIHLSPFESSSRKKQYRMGVAFEEPIQEDCFTQIVVKSF